MTFFLSDFSFSFVLCLLFIYSHHLNFVDSRSRCPEENNDFLCDNLRCIKKSYICDGEDDCQDNSDERNCFNISCDLSSHFRCNNGVCVRKEFICDGANDCKDNSDETNCANYTCLDNSFKCNSSFVCIPKDWKCDGEKDCEDGSDELECEMVKRCNMSSEFRCENGDCIPDSWRCDGEVDCPDESDENNCTTQSCTNLQFQCKTSRRCIPASSRCDGDPDCDDKSDETDCPMLSHSKINCPAEHVACRNKRQCILMSWLCDGDEDCSDGSDESNCEKHVCEEGQHLCDTSLCIARSKVCDGKHDCKDHSDEKNCIIAGCSSLTSYLCNDNLFCISQSLLCDGFNDCLDGEDESVGVNKCFFDECKQNNGNCSDICIDTKYKHRCACPIGLKLGEDGRTCVDINECRVGTDKCDQHCVNLHGGYKCMCYHGYTMNYRNECKLTNNDIKSDLVSLIFANKGDIRRINLNSGPHWFMSVLADNLDYVIALALDVKQQLLVWADARVDEIKSVSMTTKRESDLKSKTVLSGKSLLGTSFGIAVDWVNKHLYWSDRSWHKISVSFLNGSFPTTITSCSDPRALVLHPGKRFLFVIGTDKRRFVIIRYDMDGRNKQVIINHDIVMPTGLAIDFDEDRLFWIDMKLHQISSCDLNGDHRVDILTSSYFIQKPYGIALLYDKVYWTDRSSRKLLSCNKWSGKRVHVIDAQLNAPFSLRINNPRTQPEFASSCLNHHCQYICLPSVSSITNYTCMCPNGYVRSVADESKCTKLSTFRDRTNSSSTRHLQTTLQHNNITSTSFPSVPTYTPNDDDGDDDNAPQNVLEIFCLIFGGFMLLLLILLLLKRFHSSQSTKMKAKIESVVYRKEIDAYQCFKQSEDFQTLLVDDDDGSEQDKVSVSKDSDKSENDKTLQVDDVSEYSVTNSDQQLLVT